ncbi:hypothetical protein HEK616_03240 [Streptomyces nigrescens]|uniref:Uncharacterized protein n=1 Tax=Streptomyces nigrescens TaxID=1920 RepID=A0ABM7ZKN2_STRNI|nr:hypothetical protein HEK616_03240 [Streptomyces nigrescens]
MRQKTPDSDSWAVDPFDPFGGEAPWEMQRRQDGEERSREAGDGSLHRPSPPASAEREDRWEDMTTRHYDFIGHVLASDLPHANRTLATAVALHCGPNSHGCSASVGTLADETRMTVATYGSGSDSLRRRS